MKKRLYMVIVIIFSVAVIVYFVKGSGESALKNFHKDERGEKPDFKTRRPIIVPESDRIETEKVREQMTFARRVKQKMEESKSDSLRIPARLPLDMSETDFIRLREITPDTNPVLFDMGADVLEEIWREQEPDREWTDKVSSFLMKKNDDRKVDPKQVLAVSCKKELCKVTIRIKDDEDKRQLEKAWFFSLPQEEKGEEFASIKKTEEKNQVATIYFSRHDHVRPFLELRERIYATLEK